MGLIYLSSNPTGSAYYFPSRHYLDYRMSEPTGPAKSLGGVGAVKCTYPTCKLAFRSVREMKNHKRNDAEHDYCNKCDVDCDSWDDYVEHKANANPKVHIACLHCGQDFKSIPGRNRHIAQVSGLSCTFCLYDCGAVWFFTNLPILENSTLVDYIQ